MKNDFQILPHKPVSSKTLIMHDQGRSNPISLDDPASSVMTDFQHIRPFSISSKALIEQINQKMIACGVRLLFVTDDNEIFQGLVTYTDIFGEKSVQYVQEHGGLRDEITAMDIMTPLNQLQALLISDIMNARVGDILTTIKNNSRQHLLVVMNQADDTQVIAGMFSSTQMEKQLEMKIDVSHRANTFADLGRALSG